MKVYLKCCIVNVDGEVVLVTNELPIQEGKYAVFNMNATINSILIQVTKDNIQALKIAGSSHVVAFSTERGNYPVIGNPILDMYSEGITTWAIPYTKQIYSTVAYDDFSFDGEPYFSLKRNVKNTTKYYLETKQSFEGLNIVTGKPLKEKFSITEIVCALTSKYDADVVKDILRTIQFHKIK